MALAGFFRYNGMLFFEAINRVMAKTGHISDSIAENAIRPFAVGRKNWLFCDMPKGAEANAIVYTLVETAKANGLNSFRYLNYMLLNMASGMVAVPFRAKRKRHDQKIVSFSGQKETLFR